MNDYQLKLINDAKTAADFTKALRTPRLQLDRKIKRFNEMLLKRGRELMQEATEYKKAEANKNDAVGGFSVVSSTGERFINDEAMSVINDLYNGIDARVLVGMNADSAALKLHSEELKKVYRAV